MKISRDIVSPAHCKAIGPAIWLYLYLLRHDGPVVMVWGDAEAKATLGITSRRAYGYLDRLEDGGYVTVRNEEAGLTVYVTNKEG